MAGNKEPGNPSPRTTQPITHLLKKHQVGLSAVKANHILIAKGILEERSRPSETEPGKLRQYKALTEVGLRYGINQAQQLVDETTPRYYEDSFAELVAEYLTDK